MITSLFWLCFAQITASSIPAVLCTKEHRGGAVRLHCSAPDATGPPDLIAVATLDHQEGSGHDQDSTSCDRTQH